MSRLKEEEALIAVITAAIIAYEGTEFFGRINSIKPLITDRARWNNAGRIQNLKASSIVGKDWRKGNEKIFN